MAESHLSPLEVDCPADMCDAQPGETCRTARGYPMLGVHYQRVERSELHELVGRRVSDSDIVVYECSECDYEDAA